MDLAVANFDLLTFRGFSSFPSSAEKDFSHFYGDNRSRYAFYKYPEEEVKEEEE
jgi:hypothetical protein